MTGVARVYVASSGRASFSMARASSTSIDEMPQASWVVRSIRTVFQTFKKRYGYAAGYPKLSTAAFRRPGEQLALFA